MSIITRACSGPIAFASSLLGNCFLENQTLTTPESTEFKSNFDTFVRQFPSELFLDQKSGLFVVKKESWINFDQRNREYLAESHFWGRVSQDYAYQMHSHSFAGADNRYRNTFYGGIILERNDEKMLISNKFGDLAQLSKVDNKRLKEILSAIEYKPLPRTFEPQLLGELPNGSLILIITTAPHHEWDSESRLFIGELQRMREISISKKIHIRETGLSILTSEIGQVFVSFQNSESPSRILGPDGRSVNIAALNLNNPSSKEIISSLGIKNMKEALLLPFEAT